MTILTPLQRAVWSNNTNLAEFLIFSGADINVKTSDNNTLLHYSVNGNLTKLAKILIVFGLDLEEKNKINQTPLDIARGFDTTTLLLDLGAEISDNTLYNDTRIYKELFYQKSKDERDKLKHVTMKKIQREVGIGLMRYVQDDIIGICLAMFPLDLPAYVLLWIIDWLPNYDKLFHLSKITLIQNVYASIRKLK